MMAGQILVALKSQDRLSRMIPYIEGVAKPGMQIVLLVPFSPAAVFNASRDNFLPLTVEEAKFFASLPEASFINRAQPIGEQKRLVEHKVFLALESLLKRGIDVKLEVYTGSLRRALKKYTLKGDVHLIIKRAGKALMMMQFFRPRMPNFVLLQRPSPSPLRMFRPQPAA
jgi:hypothetical protein